MEDAWTRENTVYITGIKEVAVLQKYVSSFLPFVAEKYSVLFIDIIIEIEMVMMNEIC